MDNNGSLMTPERVSHLTGIPEGRLARWRSKKVGPSFKKLEGRVFYDIDSVVEYLNRSTVHIGTARQAA